MLPSAQSPLRTQMRRLRVRVGPSLVEVPDRYVEGAQVQHALDRAFATATLLIGTPLEGQPPRDGIPALQLGARVEMSVVYQWGEVPLFLGRVEEIDDSQDPIQVTLRDDVYELAQRFIEYEQPYATATLDALEQVISSILTDWTDGTLTLFTPTPPGWVLSEYLQDRGPVLDALETLVGQIGWDLRYRYIPSLSAWRLTLTQPRRTITVPDLTISKRDRITYSRYSVTRAEVRNRVRLYYGKVSGTTGLRPTVLREDAPSQSQYGVRYMQIDEAETSQIDTVGEAQAMADAILADLAQPSAQHEISTLLLPTLEVGDFLRLEADELVLPADADAAVIAFSHRISREGATTSITLRGKPAARYRSWYAIEARPGLGRAQQEPPPPAGVTLTSGVTIEPLFILPWLEATWTPALYEVVGYEVRYKPSFAAEWPTAAFTTDARLRVTGGLLSGSTVQVQVRSMRRDGSVSGWSTQASILIAGDTTPPGPPQALTAAALQSGIIRLTWFAPIDLDLDEYRVYVNTVDDFTTANVVADLKSTEFIYAEDGSTAGQTRYFWVTAEDVSGNESSPAGSVSAILPPTAPDATIPQTFASVSLALDEVTYYRDAQGNQMATVAILVGTFPTDAKRAGVYVQYRLSGSPSWQVGEWLTGTSPGTITLDDLLTQQDYQVRLLPISWAGVSGTPSSALTISTLQDNIPPGVPGSFGAAAGPGGVVRLSWTAPTDKDLSQYEIRRGTTATFSAATVLGFTDSTVYVDATAAYGTTYHYWVRAIDRSGNAGSWTSSVSLSVPHTDPDLRTPSSLSTSTIGLTASSVSQDIEGTTRARLTIELDDITADTRRAYVSVQMRRTATSWVEMARVQPVSGLAIADIFDLLPNTSYQFRAVPVSHFGIEGTAGPTLTQTTPQDTTPPTTPTASLLAYFGLGTWEGSWTEATEPDYAYSEYQLERLTPSAGIILTQRITGSSVTFLYVPISGDYVLNVRHVDRTGNQSGAAVSATVTV